MKLWKYQIFKKRFITKWSAFQFGQPSTYSPIKSLMDIGLSNFLDRKGEFY